MSDKTDPGTLIGRVFAVLEALVTTGESIGPRALARESGVERSAVGRILLQLAEIGVVERKSDGYEVGPRLFQIASSTMSVDSFTKAATPVIDDLAKKFDESCYICLRRGDYGVMTHQAQASQPVRYVIELHRAVPLYAGAAGRAILSGLPDSEFDDYVRRTQLRPITSTTVATKRRLRELVEEVREVGYSLAFEEVVEGGWAVASPFHDRSGICMGAVILTSPMARLNEADIPAYGDATRRSALSLSKRLGHVG